MTDRKQSATGVGVPALDAEADESAADRRLRAIYRRQGSEEPALAMAWMLYEQVSQLRREAAQQFERAEELRASAEDLNAYADNLESALARLSPAASEAEAESPSTLHLQCHARATRHPDVKLRVGETALPPITLPDLGSSRLVVLAACSTGQGPWTAKNVHNLLVERGWTTKSDRPENVVGNVLNQLAKDGAFQRIGRGVYKMTPEGQKLATRLLPRSELHISNSYAAAVAFYHHGLDSPARDLEAGQAPEEGATIRAEEVTT